LRSPVSPSVIRRTPAGMRELISRITVSVSGRLTEPLKCTLLGGMAPSFPLRTSRDRLHHAQLGEEPPPTLVGSKIIAW
jgi:hypothetical protein